jgi:membrane protease YdiL (CAAX protease family)
MAVIGWLFWSASEKRLRAGWRILIYTLLWIFAPAVAARLIGSWLAMPLASAFPTVAGFAPHAVGVLLKLIIVVLVTCLAAWWLDRRSLADYGLRLDRIWWLDFGFGLSLGAMLMTLIFVVEWLVGWLVITGLMQVGLPGVSFATAILGALLLFVVVGITEELLARGYHLRNMAEGFNLSPPGSTGALALAWLLSSSFFGLLHIFNPNATWQSTLALMAAGLFLGLGYVLTGSLAIPIGLHITWNFFQGNLFGLPVSGNTFDSATVFAIQQRGPPLWTGGAFGPEAGLLGMFALVLGALLTMLWVRWRHGAVRLQTRLAIYQQPHQATVQQMEQVEIGDW